MKTYIINPDKLHPETLEFYKSFANLTNYIEDADIIISANFDGVDTDKKVIVGTNTTGLDHIKAPNAQIVSLRGLDLTEFTAVPELCIGMAIYLMRLWKKEEIKGKTLGIIGYGRIGRQLADYATVMGMNVIAIDKEGANDSVYTLEKLLAESDIVSLHITADEENRNWLNLDKIKLMKDGAILLNSARPWLVDYEALSHALHTMKLAGAWFDFDVSDYFKHARMYTTPHLGGTTVESTKRSELLIAKEIKKLCVINA